MLVTALRNFVRKFILSFFQHCSDNNMFSVKWKLSVKSLDKKCQAFRDLGKGILNKDVAEKYRLPRNTISTWGENKWKSLHVHEAARKQSRILTYFTENKYQFLQNYRYIFSLLLPLRLTKVNTEVNTVLGLSNPF